MACLSDEDKSVRLAAMFVLGQCDNRELDDEITIDIMKALKDGDEQVHAFASAALSEFRFGTTENRPTMH